MKTADLYHKITHPSILVVFGSFSRGDPKFCLQQSCLLKPLWIEQSCSAMATQKLDKKVHQHDKMQNQAKLAAGAHRGHIAEHVSKCLH